MLALTSSRSHSFWWRGNPVSKRVTLWPRHYRYFVGHGNHTAILSNPRLPRLPIQGLLPRTKQGRAASSAAAARPQDASFDRMTQQLLQFRYDVKDGSDHVIQRYEEYIGNIPIEPQDTLDLLRHLHRGIWTDGLLAAKTEGAADNLQRLLHHYYTGNLPASAGATTALLSICRDCGAYNAGIELWQWAENRGQSVVSYSTYGAAIDLYTAAGQDLDACEELFQRAIRESSSAFNSYLLSPNAVLSAPERELVSTGVSSSLLASIANARLKGRKWNSAYLAVDSILKLKPDRIPSRLIHSVSEQRPLEEALRLFRLVCLGGSKATEGAVVRLFHRLRLTQEYDLRSSSDRRHHVFLASIAQINLLHIAIATGQPLTSVLANMILIGMLVNLPRTIHLDDTESKDRFNALAERLKDSVLRLLAASQLPHLSPHYAMAKAASKLRNQQLFEKYIEHAPGGHFRFHAQQHSEIFEAALRFGDAKLLEHTLSKLGLGSKAGSFKKLVRALLLRVRTTEELSACRTFYVNRYPDALQRQHHDSILVTIAKFEKSLRSHRQPAMETAASLKRQETRILGLIERLNRLSHLTETLRIRDFAECPLPRLSLHKALGKVPDGWQRTLYKEMHLDPLSRREPYQQKPAERYGSEPEDKDTGPKTSTQFVLSTGISYKDARLELFSGMNEIFLLAHGSEFGPKDRDRRGRVKSYTEQLEALASSEMMQFPSEEAWKARVRGLRNDFE